MSVDQSTRPLPVATNGMVLAASPLSTENSTYWNVKLASCAFVTFTLGKTLPEVMIYHVHFVLLLKSSRPLKVAVSPLAKLLSSVRTLVQKFLPPEALSDNCPAAAKMKSSLTTVSVNAVVVDVPESSSSAAPFG